MRLDQPVDLRLQVVGGDQPVVGCGRDDEAVRHSKANRIGGLAEVRHLGPGDVDVGEPDLGQGQDHGRLRGDGHHRQLVVDAAFNVFEALEEHTVLPRREDVEAAHHLEDVDANLRAV